MEDRANESTANIEKSIERDTAEFDQLFTPEAVSHPCSGQCKRDDFERRNALYDAREAIASLSKPVLILMGDHDRNVDPLQTLSVWESTLPEKTPHCIQRVAGATHGLLRSRWFDYQITSQWPWWKQGMFLLAGRNAYAPGALNVVSDWIQEQRCPH